VNDAVRFVNMSALRILLEEYGIDPNNNEKGIHLKPLNLALSCNHVTRATREEMVNLLLDYKADPAVPGAVAEWTAPNIAFVQALCENMSTNTLKRLYRCSIAPFLITKLSSITKFGARYVHWEQLILCLQSGVLLHVHTDQLVDIFRPLFPSLDEASQVAPTFPPGLDPYCFCIDLQPDMTRHLAVPEDELLSLRHLACRAIRKYLLADRDPQEVASSLREKVRAGTLLPDLPLQILRSWVELDPA
jgi:hypothetical protein